MTTFITKDTISRLLKDVKNILKNPLTENGIYYIHDDSDIMKGYALIIGPSDTPILEVIIFLKLSTLQIILTVHQKLYIVQMEIMLGSILIYILVVKYVFHY